MKPFNCGIRKHREHSKKHLPTIDGGVVSVVCSVLMGSCSPVVSRGSSPFGCGILPHGKSKEHSRDIRLLWMSLVVFSQNGAILASGSRDQHH